jgi:hypothetical protein
MMQMENRKAPTTEYRMMAKVLLAVGFELLELELASAGALEGGADIEVWIVVRSAR